MRSETQQPEPRQARDVVAFGQEVGRALSDGRIVGRAEPFAKVFPSSRKVKRAVGVTAWVILEDIALDARLDVEGRLVAETNVRRIAANLGLARNTVSRHLARLREHGFVLHEEVRQHAVGRFDTARYVLDPSAALERFTVTPSGRDDDRSLPASESRQVAVRPCRSSCDTATSACPTFCDTEPCPNSCDTARNDEISANWPVSQSWVSQEVGHNREQAVGDQQQASPAGAHEVRDQGSPVDRELHERLTALGVDDGAARTLLAEHPAELVRDALDAVPGVEARNPAGWVVAAVRGGWEVSDVAAEQRRPLERRRQAAAQAAHRDDARATERRQQQRAWRWSRAAVVALDDDQLATAVERLTAPVPGLGRRALPEVRARLAGWAAAAHRTDPTTPLGEALAAALRRPMDRDPHGASAELPAAPELDDESGAADERLRAVLTHLDTAARPLPSDLEEADR